MEEENLVFNFKDELGNIVNRDPKDPIKIIEKMVTNEKRAVRFNICNSPLLFLSVLMKRKRIKNIEQFDKLVEKGEFYEHFSELGNRQEVKKDFLKIGSNVNYNSKIKEQFVEEFPKVYAFMTSREDLPRSLKKQQNSFSYGAFGYLAPHYDIWWQVVHDCVLCHHANIDKCIEILRSCALHRLEATLPLTVDTVKIKLLNSSYNCPDWNTI